MGRGFSVEHLIAVFGQTPMGHEFVIRAGAKMYVVKEFTQEQMTVRELNGLRISKQEIRGEPPQNVILYWYFPFKSDQLILSEMTEEDAAVESSTDKAKPKKKNAKSLG